MASAAFFATLLSTTPSFADNLDHRWGPWVEMGGRFSESRSLGEANLFAPVWQSPNSLLFFDVRANFDNHHAREGNFGLGFRHMLDNGWNLGAYGFLDVRRSSLGNTYYQSALGVEALSETFDVRANAYLPLGDRERRMDAGAWSNVASTSAAVLTGTSLGIQTQTITSLGTNYVVERAMAGFDAEVGVRLPIFPDYPKLDFRAFAGGYHFEADGMNDISGPRARLELTARDFAGLPGVKLTGGLTWQHDTPRGDQLIASIGLRIPFNAPASRETPLTYMEERMMDAVVRDVDIVTNSRTDSVTDSTAVATTSEQAINTWNNELVTLVTHLDGGGQSQIALQAELNARGSGSVVVLNGDIASTASVVVNTGQTLLGGGGTALKVRGADSGVEVDYITDGEAGSIKGIPTAPLGGYPSVVTLQSKSVIGGMAVVDASNGSAVSVIQAFQATGAVSFGNEITSNPSNGAHAGIILYGSIDSVIYQNTINALNNANSFGIVAMLSSSGMVEGNSFSDHRIGTQIESNSHVTVKNNTFDSSFSGFAVNMISGSILSGSTGNTFVPPPPYIRCNFSAGTSGTLEFTDGTSCTAP